MTVLHYPRQWNKKIISHGPISSITGSNRSRTIIYLFGSKRTFTNGPSFIIHQSFLSEILLPIFHQDLLLCRGEYINTPDNLYQKNAKINLAARCRRDLTSESTEFFSKFANEKNRLLKYMSLFFPNKSILLSSSWLMGPTTIIFSPQTLMDGKCAS